MSVRKTALDILTKWERSGQYSNIALDSALKKNELSAQDRGLLTTLCYGVIEKKITLDYIIDSLSRTPDKVDADVRNILRMGLYQLIFLDKIPAHAAVNESVSLAKNRPSSSFINAILRAYLRQKDDISFPDKSEDTGLYLSVKYSFSKEICEKLIQTFGADDAEAYLAALSTPPAPTLRVNTLKTTREALIEKLKKSGIDAIPCKYSDFGISLASSAPIAALPGFDEGEFYVQDEASHICIKALSPDAGNKLLDSCSCPGGKSFSAAIEMNNTGEICSFDLHKNKLSLIESGARRLGIDIINTKEQDGREYIPEYEEYFDAVLCDVPCSGLGVMAKKPEIRYKDMDAIRALPEIQYAILQNCSRYIKRGGTLVYSTCTVLKEENENNVTRFLKSNPDFCPVDFTVGDIRSTDGMLTLLPQKHGTDGFFIAKLQKRK